jgi:hypothetical protein
MGIFSLSLSLSLSLFLSLPLPFILYWTNWGNETWIEHTERNIYIILFYFFKGGKFNGNIEISLKMKRGSMPHVTEFQKVRVALFSPFTLQSSYYSFFLFYFLFFSCFYHAAEQKKCVREWERWEILERIFTSFWSRALHGTGKISLWR